MSTMYNKYCDYHFLFNLKHLLWCFHYSSIACELAIVVISNTWISNILTMVALFVWHCKMECKSIMILLFIIIFNRLKPLFSLTWIAQVSEEEVFHTTWKWQNTTISVVPPPLLHLPTPKFECGVSSTFTIKPYRNHRNRVFCSTDNWCFSHIQRPVYAHVPRNV